MIGETRWIYYDDWSNVDVIGQIAIHRVLVELALIPQGLIFLRGIFNRLTGNGAFLNGGACP